jgi:hypothetical protein
MIIWRKNLRPEKDCGTSPFPTAVARWALVTRYEMPPSGPSEPDAAVQGCCRELCSCPSCPDRYALLDCSSTARHYRVRRHYWAWRNDWALSYTGGVLSLVEEYLGGLLHGCAWDLNVVNTAEGRYMGFLPENQEDAPEPYWRDRPFDDEVLSWHLASVPAEVTATYSASGIMRVGGVDDELLISPMIGLMLRSCCGLRRQMRRMTASRWARCRVGAPTISLWCAVMVDWRLIALP